MYHPTFFLQTFGYLEFDMCSIQPWQFDVKAVDKMREIPILKKEKNITKVIGKICNEGVSSPCR